MLLPLTGVRVRVAAGDRGHLRADDALGRTQRPASRRRRRRRAGRGGDARRRRTSRSSRSSSGSASARRRSPKELGKLQLRLVQAGYRGGEALSVFLGIRVAFALGCFAFFMTPLFGRPNLLSALPAMGIGYVIPGFILARKAKKRQHRIRLSLADALDLLVVSVEAGLGLDQAMARVGAGARVCVSGSRRASFGSSISSCWPARAARRRCAIWRIAPASTI